MEANQDICNINETAEPMDIKWKVVCGNTNNTLDNVAQSKLNVTLSFQPSEPIVLTFTEDDSPRTLEILRQWYMFLGAEADNDISLNTLRYK
jgi:hypothetical protein